jgi:membrane dipeptidase
MASQTKIEQRVRELQQQAIIIDGHSDILIPVNEGKMTLGERPEVPDPATWRGPMGLEKHPFVQFGMSPHTIYFGPMGQYDIPRFREGGLTAQVCAVYLDDDKLGDGLRYGLEMTWQLRNEAENNPNFELITSAADIRRLKKEDKTGAILSFEGCEALGADIRLLDLYQALGLRIASLTHTRRNIYADGCYAAERQGGLTALGKQLIRKMEALKIVVDLVHIGSIGFWEILELTSAPLILSHTTPTMFPNSDPAAKTPASVFPRPRLELPRDRQMMAAIAARGGVLGLIWILHAELDDVVTDIETALEVMGPDHIGLGSDLYGLEYAPKGLEDISKVPRLTKRLVERGHSDDTILKFLGQNYLRVFEQVWGA